MDTPPAAKSGLYARFFCAFTFLTRLKLPFASRVDFTPAVLRQSVAFYPVVGLFYSLVTLGLWLGARAIGLDPLIAAMAILAAPYLINRFLHFDGLCDVLDGFLADRTPEQRLAIMKDSRNGSFAMGGATLVMLLKYLLVLSLWLADALPALLLAPILSRWLVVAMAWRAVYPRASGTAFHLVGQIGGRLMLATSLMMAACLAITGVAFQGLAAILPLDLTIPATGRGSLVQGWPALAIATALAVLWTLWLRHMANRKIGGVTGDVLGCLIETAEAVVWLGVIVVLGLQARGLLAL